MLAVEWYGYIDLAQSQIKRAKTMLPFADLFPVHLLPFIIRACSR